MNSSILQIHISKQITQIMWYKQMNSTELSNTTLLITVSWLISDKSLLQSESSLLKEECAYLLLF